MSCVCTALGARLLALSPSQCASIDHDKQRTAIKRWARRKMAKLASPQILKPFTIRKV
jgi:hypothetical protein